MQSARATDANIKRDVEFSNGLTLNRDYRLAKWRVQVTICVRKTLNDLKQIPDGLFVVARVMQIA